MGGGGFGLFTRTGRCRVYCTFVADAKVPLSSVHSASGSYLQSGSLPDPKNSRLRGRRKGVVWTPPFSFSSVGRRGGPGMTGRLVVGGATPEEVRPKDLVGRGGVKVQSWWRGAWV